MELSNIVISHKLWAENIGDKANKYWTGSAELKPILLVKKLLENMRVHENDRIQRRTVGMDGLQQMIFV